MKESWKDLIVKISAICDFAEDGHLNSYGDSFFATHKMFESVQDGLLGFTDQIQEIFFGARELGFVPSVDIRREEIVLLKPVKTAKEAGRQIKELMINVSELVGIIDADKDTTIGEKDLLSKIGGEIQQKLYFMQNYLK